MKKSFQIENHTGRDKSFAIYGPKEGDEILQINYDDVYHEEVDAIIDTIVEILNSHWEDPQIIAFRKEREKYYHRKRWEEDKYLREEYPNFEDYYDESPES